MTLSGYFMSKSVFGQQGCRALTFALARRSCLFYVRRWNSFFPNAKAKNFLSYLNCCYGTKVTCQSGIPVNFIRVIILLCTCCIGYKHYGETEDIYSDGASYAPRGMYAWSIHWMWNHSTYVTEPQHSFCS